MENKKLGLWSCIGILIGGMIGSAIFSLSGLTMLEAGPSAILTWVIAGVIMLAYGMLTSELSCRVPVSGGAYTFPAVAFGGKKGRFCGWISCWSAIVTNIAAVAFAAIYIGIYLSVPFAWAEKLQIPLALLAVLICFVLNSIDFSVTGKINTCVVLLLVATMAVYIIAALFGGNFDASRLTPFFGQGTGGKAGFISAVPTAMIGYSSVISIAYMVSEIKKPGKTVPVSVTAATVCVIVLYSLMILATMGLITAGWLSENPGMCYIPVFAACMTALSAYPWLSTVVSASAVLALMTTMLICVSMNARLLEAAANDGILPRFFALKNKKQVPALSAGLTAAAAGMIACFPTLTSSIVNFGALFNCITIAMTVLAVIPARKNLPLDRGGFLAPGGAVLPWAVLAILLVCNLSGIFSSGGMLWIYTAALLAVGIVIFFVSEKKREK